MLFSFRFLQGWDLEDLKPEEVDDAYKETEPDRSGSRVGRHQTPSPGTARSKWQSCMGCITSLPHRTVLPMLQFSLAGVIGKPDIFFNVPAVRFAFEFLQFL